MSTLNGDNEGLQVPTCKDDDPDGEEPEPEEDDDMAEERRLLAEIPVTILPRGWRYWACIANCDICGREGEHSSSRCPYLRKFPPDGELLNKVEFMIVCHCGREIVDIDGQKRCPSMNCVPDRQKRVISRYFTTPSYLPCSVPTRETIA